MKTRLQCDIVLQGGITSSNVYPLAIAKLAETYDFRSIGGSSAGALVGAWTAAAALAAKRGRDHFQTRIKNHPQELATKKDGKTVLEHLFQPQPGTRRLFKLFFSYLGDNSKPSTTRAQSKVSGFWRAGATLYAEYPLFALAGAAYVVLPCVGLLLALGAGLPNPVSFGVATLLLGSVALMGLVAAIFALIAAALGALRDIVVELPKNGFGLCSGSSDSVPNASGVLPLTDWLHAFIQDLAGRPLDETLTFGDLWQNGGKEDAEREIELVLTTTNITRGVSHRLPFLEGAWGQLFFKEEELAQLFPRPVVNWMACHAQEPRVKGIVLAEGYHGLPKPADLPILFGARMSAGLPFFLSAIPLYATRVTRDGKISLERCWFSDGGITSNFPIHLFDAPVPARPTFAINVMQSNIDTAEFDEIGDKLHRISGLYPAEDISKEESDWDRVWMPTKNNEGITAARFNSFTGTGGFLGAVLDTALNWADTELMAMPGYRDRIVHVKLAPNEGGINLNMSTETILSISKLGERSAQLIAARFAPEPGKDPVTGASIELTWDNHRWVRYRSFMVAFETMARQFRAKWLETGPWRSYDELLNRDKGDKPKSYGFERPKQYDFAVATTNKLVSLFAGSTSRNESFDRSLNASTGAAPRPKMILRVMPSLDDSRA
jgi:predicted acylesterase/phospholipase RssA